MLVSLNLEGGLFPQICFMLIVWSSVDLLVLSSSMLTTSVISLMLLMLMIWFIVTFGAYLPFLKSL